MSNILKVTTPIGGYDNNANKIGPMKTTDPSVQAPIAPDKVSKPDARSDAASQEQNVAMKYRYESNYQNFLSKLANLTNVTDEFSKIFFERFNTIANSGLSDDVAEKIAQFFDMIDMDPEDLLGFVKSQANASVRYSGAFFALLHKVLSNTSSVELKSGILEFLRRYADMAEGNHLMKNIETLLDKLSKNMFSNPAKELANLSANLNFVVGANGEGMEQNLDVLKNRILPFLNKYISSLNERGQFRDLAVELSNVVARAENGSATRVTEAFDQIMRHTVMQKAFEGFDVQNVLYVLRNTEFEKASRKQKWMNNLAEIIEEGISREGNPDAKAVFQNLMQSILLNESVYMPVLHMMLPVNIDGKLMFAEMWIDPDASKNGGASSSERLIQGLIKFDVEELGFFDLYFMYQYGKIKMQINCPDDLLDDVGEIRDGLAKIFAGHGIKTEELFVGTNDESIPISAAFPKIFERKNSVNVSI